MRNVFVETSVVKRPGTSVPSLYKKNENITVPGFVKYRGPGQPGSWRVGPYDFRDAENPDWIAVTS